MSFKDFDLGAGLQRYGDIMARGFQDQMDLERQNAQGKMNMDQQRLQNSMAIQKAAEDSGFLADNPEEFKRLGGSFVPQADLSSIGGPAPVMGRSPAIAPMQPVTQNGMATGQIESTPAYSEALRSIAAQAPGTVNLQQGYVHPYAAKLAAEIAMKKYSADAAYQRTQLLESGRTTRTTNTSKTPAEEAALNQIRSFDSMIAKLQSQQDGFGGPLKGKKAEVRDNQVKALMDQRDEVANSLRGSGKSGTKQRSVVKKQYNPALNKTKTIYSDGTEVIVDGKQ